MIRKSSIADDLDREEGASLEGTGKLSTGVG
jgi:hypothetical protein